MMRRGRAYAVVFISLGLLALAPSAGAEHCAGQPHPPAVPDDYPCGDEEPPDTPEPTAAPTPAPTPAPTAAPTQAPAPRPVAPAPVQPRTVSTPTPATTPFNVEVPEGDPLATPEIIVDSIDDPTNFNVDAEPTASAQSWIFGFFVGLLVGALIGRMSWGLRKRRRQQIFG